MSNKRKYIMATILFLAVGAASITTSLFVNSNIAVSTNDDFDVYFSKAVVNGTKDNSVITNDTTINFSAEMQTVGDIYTLEYNVTNGSKNYDASVSVNCTTSTDNIKITNEFDDETNLEATKTRTGTLTLKLTQGVSTITNVSIKCEISATEVERTELSSSKAAKHAMQSINLYNMMKTQALSDTVDFSVNSGTSGTNGIYITNLTEDGSEVYYFRGNVDNNVIFNNMCWKIMHTTETGGIKLIYNGVPEDDECPTQTGTGTIIGKAAYNENYQDNAYMGYMYGTAKSSTYEETHANTNDSTIKAYLDKWYLNNFTDTNIISKIEDTIYCNDRSMTVVGDNNKMSSTFTTLGYGTNSTLYGSVSRAAWSTSEPKPTLKCPQDNDKFTVSSSIGNGALTYPVGLITLDEAVLAGYNTYASNNNNNIDANNYLYNEQSFWTMSPYMYHERAYVNIGQISSTGYISSAISYTTLGIRPVISLKSGVTASGNGKTTNPYIID